MRYRRLQRLLACLRDAIDLTPVVVRSLLYPTLRQHARDGVSSRGVQFFNRLPLSKAHPLQGASLDRMWNVARPRWHQSSALQLSFARLPIGLEALVVFLKFGFGLAVRDLLPGCQGMECSAFSFVGNLLLRGSLGLGHLVFAFG